jgi:hypothetical protein
MWDDTPESMTHPPCRRTKLLRTVMSVELSHVSKEEDDAEDWYTEGAVE